MRCGKVRKQLQHIWKKKQEKLQKIKIKFCYNQKHTKHLIQPFEKKIHQNNQMVNLCYNYVIRYSWHGIGMMTWWGMMGHDIIM
jgi:ElaB/YqjD/DUF883 family membrane-anchored ribosome-binding protein